MLLSLSDVLAEYNGKRLKTKGRSSWRAPLKTTETEDSIHNLLAELYSDSEESQEELLDENLEESPVDDRSYR